MSAYPVSRNQERPITATPALNQLATPYQPKATAPSIRHLWVAAAVVLLCVVVDVEHWLGPKSVYALLLVPALVALRHWGEHRVRRPKASDVVLIVLTVTGVTGAIYGRVHLGTVSSTLAVFAPLGLGLTHFATRGSMSARSARRYHAWLVLVGLLYTALHAVSATVNPSWLDQAYYHHNKAFFLILAVSGAAALRKPWLVLVVAGLSTVVFLANPAATYAAAVVAAILTVLYTTHRLGKAVAVAASIVCVFVLAVAYSSLTQTGNATLTNWYFSTVGKQDNTLTRLELARLAEQRIRQAPVFGSYFAGELSLTNVPRDLVTTTSQRVEPHDDFLQMAMTGGFVGLGLYVSWIALANTEAIRRRRRLLDAGLPNQAALVRTLLIGFNASFAVAVFNPVVSESGLSATIGLFYALSMSIQPPRGNEIDPPSVALSASAGLAARPSMIPEGSR